MIDLIELIIPQFKSVDISCNDLEILSNKLSLIKLSLDFSDIWYLSDAKDYFAQINDAIKDIQKEIVVFEKYSLIINVLINLFKNDKQIIRVQMHKLILDDSKVSEMLLNLVKLIMSYQKETLEIEKSITSRNLDISHASFIKLCNDLKDVNSYRICCKKSCKIEINNDIQERLMRLKSDLVGISDMILKFDDLKKPYELLLLDLSFENICDSGDLYLKKIGNLIEDIQANVDTLLDFMENIELCMP